MARSKQFPIRLTEEREERLEELSDRLGIGPRAKVLDEAMRLALKFLDIKKEKKQEMEQVENRWEIH